MSLARGGKRANKNTFFSSFSPSSLTHVNPKVRSTEKASEPSSPYPILGHKGKERSHQDCTRRRERKGSAWSTKARISSLARNRSKGKELDGREGRARSDGHSEGGLPLSLSLSVLSLARGRGLEGGKRGSAARSTVGRTNDGGGGGARGKEEG